MIILFYDISSCLVSDSEFRVSISKFIRKYTYYSVNKNICNIVSKKKKIYIYVIYNVHAPTQEMEMAAP